MILFSKALRYLARQISFFCSFLRVVRLRLLYPGIRVDFKTRIESNCKIVCVKGGRLAITHAHLSFGSQVVCDKDAELTISRSFIGRNCVIVAKEKITIHDNCLIAEMVVIRDQDHLVDISEEGSRENFTTAPVEIHRNVWLSAKATVLKGVSIGENAVIAASAVVTQHVPAMEVWGGVPARFLRKITRN